MPTTPRLLTIPLSHYCERARWALERAGVRFREERHLQMFHLRAVRAVTRGHTVPVLVTDEGVFRDSRDIVAWADTQAPEARRLYPESLRERIASLEPRFEDELGVESRRLAYSWFLEEPRVLLPLNGTGAPAWQRVGLRLGFRFMEKKLRRYFDITDATTLRAEARVRDVFDAVARELSDGRPFLTGDRFTAADLTFASLAALVLAPETYGVPFPPLARLPEKLRVRIERMRAHPAGAFALRLYAHER